MAEPQRHVCPFPEQGEASVQRVLPLFFAEKPLRSDMASVTRSTFGTWPGHGSRAFRMESYGGGRLSIEPVLSQGLRQNRS